jgi:hypothetical protein
MDHFVRTLTRLYQVKVNWLGNKYLGMDIRINRKDRHVTLTMHGYIRKLLQRVRPNGIKGASTPAQYTPPNYANPGAQKATIDASPLASESDKKTPSKRGGDFTLLLPGCRPQYMHSCTPTWIYPIQANCKRYGQHGTANPLCLFSIQQWNSILRFQYDSSTNVTCIVPQPTQSQVCLWSLQLSRRHYCHQWVDFMR